MDLPSILAAYLIAQGSHTGGHFYEANQQDVPIALNLDSMTESWRTSDRRKAADIHGAGFEMQDRVRDLIEDPKRRSAVSIANALLKGAYVAGVPMKLSSQLGKSGGDIGGMEKASGNKHVKDLVGMSAILDLWKSQRPKSNYDFSFDVIDGAPGGRISFHW